MPVCIDIYRGFCWNFRAAKSTEMDYIGKLGASTVSADRPVLVRFSDGQVLEFDTEEEARGFLVFYNRSPSARAQNRGTLYLFKSGAWHEQTD